MQANIESTILHKKTGIIWTIQWYDKNDNEIDYSTVRDFYKKLKHCDRENDTSKAYEFREYCENGEFAPRVPYQWLR